MAGKIRVAIADRWRVLYRVYWRPLVAVVVVVYGVISLDSTLSGEFASAHVQKAIRLGNFIPHLSAWIWATIGLALLLLLGIEGALREFRRQDKVHADALIEHIAAQQTQQQAALDAQRQAHERDLASALAAQRKDYEKKLDEAKAPPKTGLEVVIDREIPTQFPGVGRILEIEFSVTNHDPMEHQLFRHLEGNADDGRLYFGSADGQENPEHQRFIQEAYRLEQRRSGEVPRRVRPGETVHGVYVTKFAWNPRRKLPDYTLVISDGRREFPIRPHGAAESAPAQPEPPPFKLRHDPRRTPLAGGWATSHYVRVTNPAGQPERRAHITAESMNPYPRKKSAVGVDPAFPHTVPPESGGTPAAGLAVGPEQEQSWLIGRTWTRPDGKISVYGFFDDTGADWELGPDERWRISYRITCGGVPDTPFSIVIEAEKGEAVVDLQEAGEP